MSIALLTDHYELTMLDAALGSGIAEERAVFEVFARALPPGRRFGVFAGLGRLLGLLRGFSFGPEELAFLEERRLVSPATRAWLADRSFAWTIDGYAEGELYFPDSPVLTVEGTFGEAVLLETLVLSVLNYDSAVASAAARMVAAAAGRPLIEMGSRRTNEDAAVAAARAAYLVGFATTSNLEAGRRYGLPTAGTAAHAFTLAHANEEAAFSALLDRLGTDTTLLVDTYDVERAIVLAVAECRRRGVAGPGAIRIDSGDLVAETRRARRQLDELGATATRIVATSDLDEYAIASLADAPVDSFGVGTRLVTGSGAPTASFIYKLVAVGGDGALRPVAKSSPDKETVGGRKTAVRVLSPDGTAELEVLLAGDAPMPPLPPGRRMRRLQRRVVESGVEVEVSSLGQARAHHREVLLELNKSARALEAGPPAVSVVLGGAATGGPR